MAMSSVILCIIAIFVPPIPVAIRKGCSGHLVLNIILLILAWFPAVIHAIYVILKYDSAGRKIDDRTMNEKGTAQTGNQQGYYGPQPQTYPQAQSGPDYGAIKQQEIQPQPPHVPEYARDVKS